MTSTQGNARKGKERHGHGNVSRITISAISSGNVTQENKIVRSLVSTMASDAVTDGSLHEGTDDRKPSCIIIDTNVEISSPRRQQVLVCAFLSPEDMRIKVDFIINCMKKENIFLTDPDMIDFVEVLPYQQCIAKMHRLDDNNRIETNLRNEDTENMTLSKSILLCATFYMPSKDENRKQPDVQDMCYTTDSRLDGMSVDDEGFAMSDHDRETLKEVYTDTCQSSVDLSGHNEADIIVNIRIVLKPENCNLEEHEKFALKGQTERAVYYIILVGSCIGVLGCIVTLSGFLATPYRKDHILSPMLSLQIAFNILFLAVCWKQSFTFVLKVGLQLNDQFYVSCLVHFYMFTLSSVGSVLLMLVLSIERWYAVSKPFAHREKCTLAFNVKMVIVIVIVSNVISILHVLAINFLTNVTLCTMQDQGKALTIDTVYSITWSVFVCLIPWGVIFSFTGFTVTKRISASRQQITEQSQDITNRITQKLTSMVLVSFVSFIVWTIPEIGVNLVFIFYHFRLLFFREIEILSIIIYAGIVWKCLVQLIIYFIIDTELRGQIAFNARTIKKMFMIRNGQV